MSELESKSSLLRPSSVSVSAAGVGSNRLPYHNNITNGSGTTSTGGVTGTGVGVHSSYQSNTNPSMLTPLEARLNSAVLQAHHSLINNNSSDNNTSRWVENEASNSSSSSGVGGDGIGISAGGVGPGASSSSSFPSHLPSSGSLSNIRPSTSLAVGGMTGANGIELNSLDWADLQFKRAGVNSLPPPGGYNYNTSHHPHSHPGPSSTSSSSSSSVSSSLLPPTHLGSHHRYRHSELFSLVDKIRSGHQHIFVNEFNQFPNVENHHSDTSRSAKDYSQIWQTFKRKDEETISTIERLNQICQHIDALNRHVNNHNHT